MYQLKGISRHKDSLANHMGTLIASHVVGRESDCRDHTSRRRTSRPRSARPLATSMPMQLIRIYNLLIQELEKLANKVENPQLAYW